MDTETIAIARTLPTTLPRVLIVDDLFGRTLESSTNEERTRLCGHLLLTDESREGVRAPTIVSPLASAVFARGQTPENAMVGSLVENDLSGTLEIVRRGWVESINGSGRPWALVLLDLCFYTGVVTSESHRRTPGMPEGRPGDDDPASYFGLKLLDAIHGQYPELPILILSSKAREDVSREFSRRGALGFIARDDLRGPELLEDALWQHGLLRDPSGELVGNSLEMLLALREARRASGHRENVLIRGERGSGKEELASYIHRMTKRRTGASLRPFVAVNAAAFSPELSPSELFGIEPRTATGVAGKIGLIEAGEGGDVFLDEIGDMPTETQAAVLRVLQERRITRVGAREAKTVDVRFLAATNADLENSPRNFRRDLLDRLRLGGTIWLPALRERKSDIPLLAETFVRQAEALRSGSRRREISADALEALTSHGWPGNVRELRSLIFDAVNRHPDIEYLVAGHLRFDEIQKQPPRPVEQPLATQGPRSPRESVARSSGFERDALTALLERLRHFEFDPEDRGSWAGRFGEVQATVARLLAAYVRAALQATRRPTPENPAGNLMIHPAMKLLTADSNLTASQAADLVKKCLRAPASREEILQDEILREALEIAVRLRPTTTRGKRKKPAAD
jgi:DNA-binding NtrC family response regulator